MRVSRSPSDVAVSNVDWESRWGTLEVGLITSWQRGREMANEKPLLATQAMAGQLVVLPWKGGVKKKVDATKVGVFFYLAMWQGLRGEALDIDSSVEIALTCSRTGVTVSFTNDYEKYSQA